MRHGASLGAHAAGAGALREVDAASLCKAVRQEPKNDAADAEAICEAVTRPNMRFVVIKSVEQQSVLAMHRIRA